MGFNYDVFFSYRHRPLDGEITQKSFNALESYKLPRALRKQGFEDIRRAFRDTEELPVSRILTETIDEALHSCNCLVVVCSTDTPASEWIDREVSIFIEIGRADHIYPLLINGDPEHSFPPSLKLIPDIEGRIMDIRTDGNDIKKMMSKADTELLKVIAGVTGCGEDELFREHQMRKNRKLISRAGGAAAVLLAVTGISLGLMNMANNYRDEAARREQASMRILNELTYSLPDHLTNVPGAYSKIADILRSNTEDINAILRLSKNKEAAEYEAAANYEKLATAGIVLGQYNDALISEDQAIDIFSLLASSEYPGSRDALASAYNNRGRILNAMGRYSDAGDDFQAAIDLLGDDETADPLLLASIALNAGANSIDSGNNSAAAEWFEKSIETLSKQDETGEIIETAAKANYNYGILLQRTGKYDDAEIRLSEAIRLYSLLREYNDSLLNISNHVQATSALAVCLTDQGRYEEAGSYYEAAISAAETLAADGDNTDSLLLLASLYNNRGLCFNIQGEYASADAYYEKAADIYMKVSDRTGTASDAAVYAASLLNLAENTFKLGDYEKSKLRFVDGLKIYRTACESLGNYNVAMYHAWLSYYELICIRDFDAALDSAISAYQLQPENVLVNLNLAYACLYSGYYDDADTLFSLVASLGEGQVETIIGDLDAQQRAGLYSPHTEEVLQLIGRYKEDSVF